MRPPQAQPGPTRLVQTALGRAARALACAGCVAVACAIAGCGAPEAPADEIDEMMLLSAAKDVEEVPLGEFSVSIPGVRPHPMGGPEARNLVQMDFRLSMETTAAAASAARRAAERRRGDVCNRVIGVCRSTNLDDLNEQDLVTFKSHLLDSLEPLFGRDVISRLIVTDVMTNPL
ncbi:hypothetical protein Pla175_01850 [Pirellulimonas nuda]|uniref:Flagellar protein FliL n=1 Tax=Pirellulimonas nuda TaxID=2528009 RepID=A0A518D5T2_9BACT|nr:hypothetical protein [Pirellulimonas nuda]QDU86832.1 hypothetical protein Pla175_01850 [Pirellulimonas nuda]